MQDKKPVEETVKTPKEKKEKKDKKEEDDKDLDLVNKFNCTDDDLKVSLGLPGLPLKWECDANDLAF